MRCTIKDVEFVNSILGHDDIFDNISDDGVPGEIRGKGAEVLLNDPACYVLSPDENSVFIYIMIDSTTYEAHANVLKKGQTILLQAHALFSVHLHGPHM